WAEAWREEAQRLAALPRDDLRGHEEERSLDRDREDLDGVGARGGQRLLQESDDQPRLDGARLPREEREADRRGEAGRAGPQGGERVPPGGPPALGDGGQAAPH